LLDTVPLAFVALEDPALTGDPFHESEWTVPDRPTAEFRAPHVRKGNRVEQVRWQNRQLCENRGERALRRTEVDAQLMGRERDRGVHGGEIRRARKTRPRITGGEQREDDIARRRGRSVVPCERRLERERQ